MMVWSRGSKEQYAASKMDSDQQKENKISNSLCFFFKFHGLQNQKPGEYRVHVQALHLGIGSFRCRTGDV
jgi:hypothetical protein